MRAVKKFQEFCSSELQTYIVFNGITVGVRPKGMPGKM